MSHVANQNQPGFNQDLEILKVNIMSDYALGMFLAKFAGLIALMVSLSLLWYQTRFPTPSNNPSTYLDPSYYLGVTAIMVIGLLTILATAFRPYRKQLARLDELIDRINSGQSVGRFARSRD